MQFDGDIAVGATDQVASDGVVADQILCLADFAIATVRYRDIATLMWVNVLVCATGSAQPIHDAILVKIGRVHKDLVLSGL